MSITDGILYFHNDQLGPIPDGANDQQDNEAFRTDYFGFGDEMLEFYNLARTRALIDAMHPPNVELLQYGDKNTEGLWTMPDSFYQFGASTMPVPSSPGDVANPAPWYRSGVPASAEACGLIVVESSGDGAAHYGRSAIPRGPSGATFSPSRAAERVIVCRALAVGVSARGAEYMYRWAEERLLDLGSNGPLNWNNIVYRLWNPDPDDVADYPSVDEWAADGLVKGDRAVAFDPPAIDRLTSEVSNVIQFTFTIAVGQPVLTSLYQGKVDVTPIAGTLGAGYKIPLATNAGDSVVPIINWGTLAQVWDAEAEARPRVSLDLYATADFPPGGDPFVAVSEPLVSAIKVEPYSGVVVRLDYAAREINYFDPYVSATSRNPAGDDYFYAPDFLTLAGMTYVQSAVVRRRRVFPGGKFISQSQIRNYGFLGPRPARLEYGKESPWNLIFDHSYRAEVIYGESATTYPFGGAADSNHAISYVLVTAHGLSRTDNW